MWPIDPMTTTVTVVTQRRMKTNIFTVLTEGTFHDQFAEAVNRLRSSQRSQHRTSKGATSTVAAEAEP